MAAHNHCGLAGLERSLQAAETQNILATPHFAKPRAGEMESWRNGKLGCWRDEFSITPLLHLPNSPQGLNARAKLGRERILTFSAA
jgi:hypothetical protein